MSRHEAPDVGAMVERMFRALVRRAGDGDTQALEQLARLELVARDSVAAGGLALHSFGYSWTEIGTVTGTTRQAARQRCTTDAARSAAAAMLVPKPGQPVHRAS